MTEQVSAFLDGEMDRERLGKNIQKLLSDKHAMQTYQDYQRIGEMMRGQHESAMQHDLTSQIMAKIDAEPTVLSPNAIQAPSSLPVDVSAKESKPMSPSWSIAASVAAVMVVGLFSWQNAPTEQSPIVQAGMLKPASVEQSVNRLATVDSIPARYLQAHRASAPSVGSHYIQAANYTE